VQKAINLCLKSTGFVISWMIFLTTLIFGACAIPVLLLALFWLN